MKNILLIMFVLIYTTLFSQQSGIAEYEFTYNNYSQKAKNKIEADARKRVDMSAEYAKEFKYIMKFNANESLYYIEDSMPTDEIVNEFEYKFSKFIFSNGIYYQNKITLESLNQRTSMGKLFLVTDSIQSNWVLTSETKYIGKYKCYKAESTCNGCNKKQTVVVWFSPEITEPFGPAGYGGTPGLIMEVSRYRYTLRLKKIKLLNKPITIKKPVEGTFISADELKAIQIEKRMEMSKRRNN